MTHSDGVTRALAWIEAMKTYQGPPFKASDSVEDVKEAYVAGEITLEALEARLTVAFSAERARR